MTFKKLYHKPLPFLKTCFIKCTTKKMAKRKGNKTMSNTVQRLRKKYPQRLRDHHEFFRISKKELYHLVMSKLYTTGWERNCENNRHYITLRNKLKICFSSYIWFITGEFHVTLNLFFNIVAKKQWHTRVHLVPHFFVLTTFDVTSDLLQNRPTVTSIRKMCM